MGVIVDRTVHRSCFLSGPRMAAIVKRLRAKGERALCLTLLAAFVLHMGMLGQETTADSTAAQPFSCEDQKVERVIEFLSDTELIARDSDRAFDAIRCLEWKRPVEAIAVLINLITWRYTYPEETTTGAIVILRPTQGTGSRFPATGALAEIGKRALPHLVKVIETNGSDSLEAKNARYTVRQIFRYEEESRFDEFFKEAAEKASTPEAKARLLKALETADEDWKSD